MEHTIKQKRKHTCTIIPRRQLEVQKNVRNEIGNKSPGRHHKLKQENTDNDTTRTIRSTKKYIFERKFLEDTIK